MKKIILLSFMLTLMCSCGKSYEEQVKENQAIVNGELPKSDNVLLRDISIVVIDNCEYIQYRTHNNYFEGTHKGNCKYCAERARQANLIRISL